KNKSGEGEDLIGHSNNSGNLEGREADGKDVDGSSQDARKRKRQSDMPQGSPGLETVHSSGFFEGRVHRAIGCHDHDKRNRGQTQSLDPAHADDRRDIKRIRRQAKRTYEELVYNPNARMK